MYDHRNSNDISNSGRFATQRFTNMIWIFVLFLSVLAPAAESAYPYPYQTIAGYPHHSGLVFPLYYPLYPGYGGAGLVHYSAPKAAYSTVVAEKKVDAKYYYGGHFQGKGKAF